MKNAAPNRPQVKPLNRRPKRPFMAKDTALRAAIWCRAAKGEVIYHDDTREEA